MRESLVWYILNWQRAVFLEQQEARLHNYGFRCPKAMAVMMSRAKQVPVYQQLGGTEI